MKCEIVIILHRILRIKAMYELVQPAHLILMQEKSVNCEMRFNKTRVKNAIHINIVTNKP